MIGPMRANIASTSCCGMKELHNLCTTRWDPKLHQNVTISMEELVTTVYDYYRTYAGFCFVIFSDIIKYDLKQGIRLAEYIREQGLGDVLETAPTRNPNSRNLIHAWLWVIDMKAMKKWYTKESRREVSKD